MAPRTRGTFQAWVPGVVTLLALVLVAMWPAFRIPFGIIDDHDIVDIVGHRRHLPWSEVPSEFFQRADDALGRFRPVYWLGRVLESAFAGRDPFLWWLDRFVLASVCVVAVFSVLRHHLPQAWSAPVSFLLVCGAQFETFGRLGPNETYAMPLACVAVALLARGMRRGDAPARQWPAFVVAALAAGAKENFVVLSGVLVVATIGWQGVTRMRRVDWLVAFAALGLLAADTAMILVKLARYGSQYPQARDLSTLAAWTDFAARTLDDGGAVALGLVLFVLVVLVSRGDVGRGVVWVLAVTAVGGALQLLFYAGAPMQGRYLYPLAMAVVVLWGAVVVLARRVANRWVRVLVLGVVGLSVGASVVRGVWTARLAEEAAEQRNHAFSQRLHDLERVALDNHVDSVVLQPAEPLTDQERVFSLGRYLHADTGIQVMTLPATKTSGSFSASLGGILEEWSRHGGGRLAPYRPTERCLSVLFGDSVPVCPRSVAAPG